MPGPSSGVPTNSMPAASGASLPPMETSSHQTDTHMAKLECSIPLTSSGRALRLPI
jgi:hypothetical protein